MMKSEIPVHHSPTTRDQIFISYSRKDRWWLEQLQTFLKPITRKGELSVWDDTKIKSGDEWREQIKTAIASAKVAVLIVSPDFLASDFIAEHELPPLLEAAQKEGLRILWIPLRHSLVAETEIARYQAVIDPAKPLAGMTDTRREKELVRICQDIKSAAQEETLRTTHSIPNDETLETPVESEKRTFDLASPKLVQENSNMSQVATQWLGDFLTPLVNLLGDIQKDFNLNTFSVTTTPIQLYSQAQIHRIDFFRREEWDRLLSSDVGEYFLDTFASIKESLSSFGQKMDEANEAFGSLEKAIEESPIYLKQLIATFARKTSHEHLSRSKFENSILLTDFDKKSQLAFSCV